MKKLAKIAAVFILCLGVLSLTITIFVSLDFLFSKPNALIHVLSIEPISLVIPYSISFFLILGGTFMWGWDRRKMVFGNVLVIIGGIFALMIFTQLVSQVFLRDGIISAITHVSLCIISLIAGIILITFQKKRI